MKELQPTTQITTQEKRQTLPSPVEGKKSEHFTKIAFVGSEEEQTLYNKLGKPLRQQIARELNIQSAVGFTLLDMFILNLMKSRVEDIRVNLSPTTKQTREHLRFRNSYERQSLKALETLLYWLSPLKVVVNKGLINIAQHQQVNIKK